MKRILSSISSILIIAVMLGMMAVSAASYPNYYYWNAYTVPGTATVTIQHQPSYNDTEGHCMQARIRAIIQDEDDNISYTSFGYTNRATDLADTTIYSVSRSAYVPRGGIALQQHNFYWVTETGWSSLEETE